MKAKVNQVWPHKSGKLRVRVDFFPDIGDPLYDGCHVEVPERPLTPEEEAQVAVGKTPEEQNAILEEILAGIPKVWRVNPINCHMFLLPIGFTQNDLEDAIASRMPELKQKMASDALYATELRGLPLNLQGATYVLKGKGVVLIPTFEKEWTPILIQQAGDVLNGLEVQEK